MEEQDIQKMATTVYLLKADCDKHKEDLKGLRAVIYGNGAAGIAENMRDVLKALSDIDTKLDDFEKNNEERFNVIEADLENKIEFDLLKLGKIAGAIASIIFIIGMALKLEWERLFG